MIFSCHIGLHKYIYRELHYDEKPTDKVEHLMTVIERCACGKARFPLHGKSLLTKLVVSTKLLE
jgi:hypothetical protein